MDPDIDFDAYNIEAKYLDKLLEFLEKDTDIKLSKFIDSPDKNNFHELINSIITLLNKLSRSSRIKKKFFENINKDLKKMAKEIENSDKLPVNDLLRILNKINRQTATAHLFTKPSMTGDMGIKKEGPDSD
jgi:hypothetical protein